MINLEKYLEKGVRKDDLEILWDAAKGVEHIFEEYAERRAKSEPIAYILNKNNFMGLEFYVDNRVYITTQETSYIVQHLIERIKADGDSDAQILDIGTGSGAIAISIKSAIPSLRVLACDVSTDALNVAKLNSEKLNAPIELFESRYADNYNDSIVPKYIVANLPYGDIVSNEYEVDSYYDISVSELNYQPSMSITNPLGETKSFEDVVLSIKAKGWETTLYFECGKIPEHVIKKALPADCKFNYIPIYDADSNHVYSLVEVIFMANSH